MSTHHHSLEDAPLVPPMAVAILGGFLLCSLLIVATVRWSGVEIRTPDAPSIHIERLVFEDLPDGSIAVIDAESRRLTETIRGEAGFLRGALRVLAHERTRRGISDRAPFELHLRQDGRLTLMDPQTGVRLDLESFGPQHASSFARLMKREAP